MIVGGSLGVEFASPFTSTVITRLCEDPCTKESAPNVLPPSSPIWTRLIAPEFGPLSSLVAENACCWTLKVPLHELGLPFFLHAWPPTVPYCCSQLIAIVCGPDWAEMGASRVQYRPPESLPAAALAAVPPSTLTRTTA